MTIYIQIEMATNIFRRFIHTQIIPKKSIRHLWWSNSSSGGTDCYFSPLFHKRDKYDYAINDLILMDWATLQCKLVPKHDGTYQVTRVYSNTHKINVQLWNFQSKEIHYFITAELISHLFVCITTICTIGMTQQLTSLAQQNNNYIKTTQLSTTLHQNRQGSTPINVTIDIPKI